MAKELEWDQKSTAHPSHWANMVKVHVSEATGTQRKKAIIVLACTQFPNPDDQVAQMCSASQLCALIDFDSLFISLV